MFSELAVGSFCVIALPISSTATKGHVEQVCYKNKNVNVITTLQLFTFLAPSPGISVILKQGWKTFRGSDDSESLIKGLISCSTINLVRPHFDCRDCARLGWRIQVNRCHPAGTTYDIPDFIADTKTEPPTHTQHKPHKPLWLVLL